MEQCRASQKDRDLGKTYSEKAMQLICSIFNMVRWSMFWRILWPHVSDSQPWLYINNLLKSFRTTDLGIGRIFVCLYLPFVSSQPNRYYLGTVNHSLPHLNMGLHLIIGILEYCVAICPLWLWRTAGQWHREQFSSCFWK